MTIATKTLRSKTFVPPMGLLPPSVTGLINKVENGAMKGSDRL